MCFLSVPVLLLPMSLDVGGAETHVVGLARGLKARGWEVHVASAGGRLVGELLQAGISHRYAPLNSRSPLKLFQAYRLVADLVVMEHIQLVHAHARIPAWIGEKVCRVKRIPLVTTYHGTFVAGFPWNFFTRPGDYTIAVSHDIREYVIQKFGFPASRVTVIPNGIDTEVFHPPSPSERATARMQMGLGQDDWPVVAYVSRLDGDLVDCALITIQAIRSLLHKYPGARLLIAGDGAGFKAVARAAEEVNRLAGRNLVGCLGFVHRTELLYSAVDAVVGMSRVALEAMACGVPVIIAGPGGLFGTVTESMVEMLEKRNYTSRGAPEPITAERLSYYMDALFANPYQASHLGQMGRYIVTSRHSTEAVTEAVENIYRMLLAGRPD